MVRTAASGKEMLSSVAAEKPDLILLDILLGDTSGIKLTTRWKNEAETAHIPIILLTAKDSETDVIVGLSVGADDYITKPFGGPPRPTGARSRKSDTDGDTRRFRRVVAAARRNHPCN